MKTNLMMPEEQIQAICILLSDHFIGDSFDFNFFEEIFKQMGLVKNSKVRLDNKSTRIMSRLGKYMVDAHIYDIEKLFKSDFSY
jgi:hypothetical protein